MRPLLRCVCVHLCVACAEDPSGTPPTPTGATSDPGETSGEPPNVLVVVADDLGADLLAAFGEGQPAVTPTLDRLVDEGVLFEQAYATPVCSSTRAALLTGRYGRRTGVGGVISDDEPPFALPLDEVTVAELLSRADPPYTSSAVGKWHLANDSWPEQFDHAATQGFAHRAGSDGNLNDYFVWVETLDGQRIEQHEYATTVAADRAIDTIVGAPEPWFVYLAFNAVHTPLHHPPPGLVPSGTSPETWPGAIRAATEAMDTELGRVLAAMDADVLARTTIVVVGDNGTTAQAVLPPFDPEDSKGQPTEGGTHVPLIVAGAGVTPGRSRALVHVVDVFPTIAELAGLDGPALTDDRGSPLVLDGHSLVPWLVDPAAASGRDVLYNERFSPNGPPPYDFDWVSVRDDRYLYAQEAGGAWRALYDVSSTWPVPSRDLTRDGVDAEEHAAIDRLRGALAAIQADLPYAYGP